MLSVIFLHFNDLLSRDSIIPRDAASDSTRSLVNIVWGCFGTLFACTWIAIHTNIPAPKEKATSVLARRLAVMLYMLIVPELVIMWAARQFMAARQIARRNVVRGWTKTHAFFAIMGGFQLYVDRKLVRTLQVEELETLESEGKISWPHITVEEIKDKSKADYFSKAVVVLQVLWFVTQCVARGVERIALTQLEVSTLAFSAITMFTYILWWNKPMDIGVAEKVHLKEGFSLKDTYSEEEWQRIQNPTPSQDPEEHQLLPLDIREGSILNIEGGEANAGPLTTTEGSALPSVPSEEMHLLSLHPSTSAAGTNEAASFTDLEEPLRQTELEDTLVFPPSISNPALPPSEDLPLEITIGAVPTEAAQVPLPPDESQLLSEPVVMGDPSPVNTIHLPSVVDVDIGIVINHITSDDAHSLSLEPDSARSKKGHAGTDQTVPSGNDIPARLDEQDSAHARINQIPGDGGDPKSTYGVEQAVQPRSLPDEAYLGQSSTSIPKLENRGSSANSDNFFKKLKHTPLTYIRYKLGDEIHSFTLTMEEIMLAFPNVLPIIPKKLAGEVTSLRKVIADLGCTIGVVYCFIELPIKFILLLFQLAFIYPGAALITFALGFGAMVNNTTLVSKATIRADRHKGFVHEPPLRVPTFYSPKIEGKESYFPLIIASVVALIFGSIHCIAWNFDFPTSKESQYWRIASALVSSGPVALIIIGIILQFFLDENSKNLLEFFAYFIMLMTGSFIIFMYTLARICLLILPLIGLRHLPPAAFIDIDWTVFVPHVHI
ncbi:hypothetical protein CPC08DRAFT_820412 [Agrocybe pediades]|nr:hypothetical protein CPC08DRAFT_820412 [Agrocybe pediades]